MKIRNLIQKVVGKFFLFELINNAIHIKKKLEF